MNQIEIALIIGSVLVGFGLIKLAQMWRDTQLSEFREQWPFDEALKDIEEDA